MQTVQQRVRHNLQRQAMINERKASATRLGLKKALKANLDKGQTVEENEGLILRFYGTKPQGLTQMQEAMANAV